MLRIEVGVLLIAMMMGVMVRADEVVLSNGDRLNGKVGTIAAGKMKFTSPALGELTIDMANVQTYTTDAPVVVRLNNSSETSGKVVAGDAGKVTLEDTGEIQTGNIKQINPPAEKWTGAIVLNGTMVRGNTHAESVGANFNATLRRENAYQNDRFTLGAGYAHARERSGGTDNTITDNWFTLGKYDKFWNPKTYGYATVRVDHDNIANLDYRVTPGLGVGYQVVERPTLNIRGEAGVSYVYEDFEDGSTNEHVALRLAGHAEKKVNDRLTLFANVEYLPAFEDPGDYNLNSDVGLRATLIKGFFAELKVELKRDSVPAPDSKENDLRYLLGLGWQF